VGLLKTLPAAFMLGQLPRTFEDCGARAKSKPVALSQAGPER